MAATDSTPALAELNLVLDGEVFIGVASTNSRIRSIEISAAGVPNKLEGVVTTERLTYRGSGLGGGPGAGYGPEIGRYQRQVTEAARGDRPQGRAAPTPIGLIIC